MKYLLGIDLGTSSLKSLLIDYTGTVIAIESKDYQFDSPHPGYAEQDPEVWWKACVETVRIVLHKSGIPASEISGVSFSGQMHGLVALDKDYQIVRPAILHADARSSNEVNQLKTLFDHQDIERLMMNPIYTGFLLVSLLWVRNNEPDIYEKIRHVCLPKDYIRFRMSGVFSSEFADASATLAFDVRNRIWSDEILNRVGVPADWFPKCYETIQPVGKVSHAASEETGLSTDTIVVSGGGDQVMQSIGNGMIADGDATVNIGSSGQVSFQVGKPILNRALNTNMFCAYDFDRWILFGATMSAGLSLKWWNQIIGKKPYEQLNQEIATVKPGSGGVIFLPYLNGERTPHLNPNISSMFIGVNSNTTTASMTRAVMEGVAFSLKQCLDICTELGFKPKVLVASGGGAKSRQWLQIQSDIYGLPLKVSETEEQASLGAAIVAGVGSNVYSNLASGCSAVIRYKDEIVTPTQANSCVYEEYYGLYKETYLASMNVLEKITLAGRKE